jgi:SAM-dependent methyltransferase
MNRFHFVRRSLHLFWLSVITTGLFVQLAASAEYKPQVGQAGKDVIWVPTCQVLVDNMLDMAKVTAEDFVIDLGSGDGRTVITAAKRGARALGIEYNPDMVALSRRNAANEGVGDRAQFIEADLFKTDFSKATVITMFLLPSINLDLRPRILDLKPGTRIVSNSFTMGEWEPDQTFVAENEENCGNFNTALFWIVPAKVQGTWKLSEGELQLVQGFQMIAGRLKSTTDSVAIMNGTIKGDAISFSAGHVKYTGRVNGDIMQGTSQSGGQITEWTATRIRN